MPYIGKKPADIIATVIDTTTGTFSGEVDAGSLDVSGNADIDGITNLDNTDIDGTLNVQGETTLQTHLNMGDNDIIKLGDSADLQIYHDSTRSYIEEGGLGGLWISTNGTEIKLKQGGGADEEMLVATPNGSVDLYWNNQPKFSTTSTGIDVTGVITTDGITTSADINFNDTVKALFGADNDLEIGHTGGNSDIKETGTGNLRIWGDDIQFFNSAGSKYHAQMITDGAVTLYNNGQAKLATTSTGIDVTGTATMDGLTVDGLTTASKANDSKQLKLERTGSSVGSSFLGSDTSAALHIFDSGSNPVATFYQNQDVAFYEDTGSTPKLFWDASEERLGIGTSSPSEILEINSGTGNIGAKLVSTDALSVIAFKDSSTTDVQYLGANGDSLVFYTGATPSLAMTFNSSNLLVGTTDNSPAEGSGVGVRIGKNGTSQFSSADAALSANRTSGDGDLITFRNSGSLIARVGFDTTTLGTNPFIAGSAGRGLSFDVDTNTIFPCTSTGARADGTAILGHSSARFQDLYLSGGVYLGGTTSVNYLDDYEEGEYNITLTCGTSGTVTLNSGFDSGSYTKVGRLVHVCGLISVASVSSPVGLFSINLPFTPANLSERRADSVANAVVTNVASANVADFVGTINEANANLFIQLGDGSATVNDSAEQLQAGTNITFSASFHTA